MKTAKVSVVPYDPQWRAAFAAIRDELEAALGDLCLAVEGLCAKPCIDLDVVIEDAFGSRVIVTKDIA